MGFLVCLEALTVRNGLGQCQLDSAVNSVGVIPGSNNDINGIHQSPLLNDIKEGKALDVSFVANDLNSNDAKRIRYKQVHEARRVPMRHDAERYTRTYESYEQFQAMTNQEAEGSVWGIKRTRTYIPRDREEAEQSLLEDYFGNDDTPPKYPEDNFRRMYRMSSTLFAKIVNDITSYDARPLPEYFCYFRQRIDALGRNSIGSILKITSAIRQLAYGTAPNAFDEYLQIVERCSRECLDNFTKCIYILYVEEYLRKPSSKNIEKTYALHEEKHGLQRMLGSINCMHWDWKNCPKVLHWQFKRNDHKYPTLMLEVVADQKLWIWHAYFGVPGSNNDLNM
ncbi:RNA-directed DNA polymerase, eukaryota [Tanacetum coccineum]